MKRTVSMICLTVILIATAAYAEEQRVLMIGNSLTYWNDLPAMIQKLTKIKVESVAFPNFSLEDHWVQGDALKAIQKKRWSVVVLQQGPSASKEGRDSLMKYAAIFAKEIRKAGAVPAFYSVWPARNRKQDLAGSIQSYQMAAQQNDAMLIPVGSAWLTAWDSDPEFALYDPDGLHPNKTASYLAALVFYHSLTGKNPNGLEPIGVDDSTATKLQNIATGMSR